MKERVNLIPFTHFPLLGEGYGEKVKDKSTIKNVIIL